MSFTTYLTKKIKQVKLSLKNIHLKKTENTKVD